MHIQRPNSEAKRGSCTSNKVDDVHEDIAELDNYQSITGIAARYTMPPKVRRPIERDIAELDNQQSITRTPARYTMAPKVPEPIAQKTRN